LHLLHSDPRAAEPGFPEGGPEQVPALRHVLGEGGIPVDQVRITVTGEEPAAALLRAGAAVLVVGGRRGALSGLVRDSVSRAVLAGAHCPVLAIPRDIDAGLALLPAASASGTGAEG
jgi:nucleotide-binding universal stress UspA family protein